MRLEIDDSEVRGYVLTAILVGVTAKDVGMLTSYSSSKAGIKSVTQYLSQGKENVRCLCDCRTPLPTIMELPYFRI